MTIYTLLIIFSIIVYFIIYNFRLKISKILSVTDLPNEKRKIHKIPTPKTASYSIAIIILTYLVFNIFLEFSNSDINVLLSGTLLIFLVGFIDDRHELSALTKIICITFVTFFLCLLSEDLVINKFYLYSFDFFFELGVYSTLFTVLCVFSLSNSLNLADGINGLATGIILFWLFYINQIYANNLDLLINIILINLVLIFFHNYKGKHFLGDSGSLMLSSFIAFLIIYLHNKNIDNPSHQSSAESIVVLFIIPILDMVRLFFERLINKKNPGVADNNHFHHYLIKRYSINKALLIYFLLVNIPILTSMNSSINKISIIVFSILMYFFLIIHYKNFFKKLKI